MDIEALLNLPASKLNLEYLVDSLANKLSATNFELTPVSQLIKLVSTALEHTQHPANISVCTNHKLCQTIVICFLKFLEYDCDPNEFPKILSFIRISLTCMSHLRRMNISSHILCRALLEQSFAFGYLFNSNFEKPATETFEKQVLLSEENLKVSLGHKFRRLPNSKSAGINTNYLSKQSKSTMFTNGLDKESINCYLLIEAFKSSINNIDAFSSIFVDFLCPVMLDKNIWQTDEALRVINERDLNILRKFNQLPALWGLFELIGEQKSLESCLVLIKALLAALLAQWASSSASTMNERLDSTIRLLPPLAQSDIIPMELGMAVEVFPLLTPNEVFAILNDTWDYIRHIQECKFIHQQQQNGKKPTGNQSKQETLIKTKPYTQRLRIFMCHKAPGDLFVKIFGKSIAKT